MVTNGTQLTMGKVRELFDAGLQALHIDIYNSKAEKFVQVLSLHQEDYPPIVNYGRYKVWTTNHKCIVICDERRERDHSTRALHNFAGDAKPAYWTGNIPRQSGCAEPLKMITIRHDGTYALCCHTWQDRQTFGNVKDLSLEDMYYNKHRIEMCRQLLNGDRYRHLSCNHCNVKSPFAHMFERAVGR
jgi:radical SAM protein with 4Fe4S-binding SPASM domain